MNWKTKVGVGAGVIGIIAAFCLLAKYQQDTIEKLEALEKQVVSQKRLSDETVRAESSYVTKKDLESFAKDNGVQFNEVKKDLKDLQAKVIGVSVVKVVSSGYVGSNLPSTTTTPNLDPQISTVDLFGYLKNRQEFKLTEPIGSDNVPIGKVGFSAWKEHPWDLDISSREYSVVNILGQDDRGRHYIYNKFSIEVDGQRYDLEIDQSKFVEELPKSKFRFSPRLYVNFGGGAYFTEPSGAFVPGIQMSMWSYGRTRPDPDWTFVGLGAGYEVAQDRFVFTINPLSYNVAHHIPFVNNIFVGPSVSADLTGGLAVMLGLGVGL